MGHAVTSGRFRNHSVRVVMSAMDLTRNQECSLPCSARPSEVRFAPILAVPVAWCCAPNPTFVQEAGSGCSRAFSSNADFSLAGRLCPKADISPSCVGRLRASERSLHLQLLKGGLASSPSIRVHRWSVCQRRWPGGSTWRRKQRTRVALRLSVQCIELRRIQQRKLGALTPWLCAMLRVSLPGAADARAILLAFVRRS